MAEARALRVMAVGAGPAATMLHLPVLAGLRKRGLISLSAICDLVPERAEQARRRFGFARACEAEVERSDIDAVYIFAGAESHFALGMRAIGAGKHVFVEKPIAPSFEQACQMVEAARQHGVVAVGGHNRRFQPALIAAQARGAKTGFHFAEARFHKPESGKPPSFGARSWLTANGIHALDALLFVMGGLPDHVASEAQGGHVFSALMRWPGGRQATFSCDNQAGARLESYSFHRAGESLDIRDGKLVLQTGGKAQALDVSDDRDGFAAEHQAFVDATRNGSPPLHNLAALAPSLFLAERIEEGFQGALPRPVICRPVGAVRAIPVTQHPVLVSAPQEILPSLGRHAGRLRAVSLEQVLDAGVQRPDIRAGLWGRSGKVLPAELFDLLPNLSFLGFAGLSLSRLRPQSLLARGVALAHASGAYAESVAEFALALAILGRRRAFQSHDVMRSGGWGIHAAPQGWSAQLRRGVGHLRPFVERHGLKAPALTVWRAAKPVLRIADAASLPSAELKGASAGLIGWGASARAFARRLTEAGAKVMVWSEHAGPQDCGPYPCVSLGEALAADIVSLHRGLTPHTRHFLGAAELDALRPGAVLLNVARGALIEPKALASRLGRGDIIACLDSFEEEPPPSCDPLRQLPNVFLTSHIAGGSPQMHQAAADEIVGKALAFLDGAPVDIIAPARLRQMT